MGLMNVGKSGGRADHPALRPRRAAQGLRPEPQAQRQDAATGEMSSGRSTSACWRRFGIFGIHADYMAQFRDFLEEEGLPTNDDRIEFLLPVIKNLGTQKLKTIRLKKTINGVSTEFGDAFRKLGPIPTLAKPDPATRRGDGIPAEEPGRAQLVSEDPGDEIGRRRRAAMRMPRRTRPT